MPIKRIAVTAGEPAGIGPDLTLALASEDWPHQLVVIADKNMLAERAELLGLEITLVDYDANQAPQAQQAGSLVVDHIPLAESDGGRRA